MTEHDRQAQLEHRVYRTSECVTFRKTNEEFGGLSNMAAGYPLEVNGVQIGTSEALYQACRFPDLPEIQRLIIGERSPMTAKMKSKPHRKNSRADWDDVRVRVMKWCLRVKLAQNWERFSRLLEATKDKQIVEWSRRDAYWGAVPIDEEGAELRGTNVLGRLLMEVRAQLRSEKREALRRVEPPRVTNFLLYGNPIGEVGPRSRSTLALRTPPGSAR